VDGAVEERPEPPDPATATSLADLVTLLERLRVWSGWPGRPPGFAKVEQRARTAIGVGALPRSTTHRVLSGRQDLAFVRDPARFVAELVTTLGADPTPWLAALRRHLSSTEPEPVPRGPGGWRRAVRSRRALVLASVVVLVVAGLVTWGFLDDDAVIPPVRVDYARPAAFESGDSGLWMAVPEGSREPGTRVSVLKAAAMSWDFAASHRDNADYHQLRPTGSTLMCLDVAGGSYADRAAVQQWGCNGEPHQYWRVVPDAAADTVRITNLGSGQCLSVAAGKAEAGMQLVQRVCDEREAVQRWRVRPVERAPAESAPAAVTPATVGPDPAEYPGGGKDRPCEGISPAVDPAAQSWVRQPVLIRDEDATRGRATVGQETAGAAELVRAERVDAAGTEETFYWVEGFVKFSPAQFTMALQWTTLPGPGGWHTCQVRFTSEHRRPKTVALPRDSTHDGSRDVWFRVCLSYQPEYPAPPVVNCAGRY
jgi:hypothetical protein